jgi:hypothetical protein
MNTENLRACCRQLGGSLHLANRLLRISDAATLPVRQAQQRQRFLQRRFQAVLIHGYAIDVDGTRAVADDQYTVAGHRSDLERSNQLPQTSVQHHTTMIPARPATSVLRQYRL